MTDAEEHRLRKQATRRRIAQEYDDAADALDGVDRDKYGTVADLLRAAAQRCRGAPLTKDVWTPALTRTQGNMQDLCVEAAAVLDELSSRHHYAAYCLQPWW